MSDRSGPSATPERFSWGHVSLAVFRLGSLLPAVPVMRLWSAGASVGCFVPAAAWIIWELARKNGQGTRSKALHDSVMGVPAVIHLSDLLECTSARTNRAVRAVVPPEVSLWVCDL